MEEPFSSHAKGALSSSPLILIAEATPQSSYRTQIQGCQLELLGLETAGPRQGDSTSYSSQG